MEPKGSRRIYRRKRLSRISPRFQIMSGITTGVQTEKCPLEVLDNFAGATILESDGTENQHNNSPTPNSNTEDPMAETLLQRALQFVDKHTQTQADPETEISPETERQRLQQQMQRDAASNAKAEEQHAKLWDERRTLTHEFKRLGRLGKALPKENHDRYEHLVKTLGGSPKLIEYPAGCSPAEKLVDSCEDEDLRHQLEVLTAHLDDAEKALNSFNARVESLGSEAYKGRTQQKEQLGRIKNQFGTEGQRWKAIWREDGAVEVVGVGESAVHQNNISDLNQNLARGNRPIRAFHNAETSDETLKATRDELASMRNAVVDAMVASAI